ncbi:unnamed protein product, partial [Rotaria sordida]
MILNFRHLTYLLCKCLICFFSLLGKTHYINTKYKNEDTFCFSINDTLNLSSLISSFLSFDSRITNDNPSVSFNISIHAPFEELNRTFLSLFICGSLTDTNTGLTFSLPENQQWKFFIEIPHTDKYHMTITENFHRILPILSIISPYTLEEITDENYQLFIGQEEELVARFLKAYENGTIDRFLTITNTDIEQPVDFEELTNSNECRHEIYNCIKKYAPEIPRNKISELSFTKFLYRRIRFFTGHYYRFNMTCEYLGSSVMKQMINEAKSLAHIDFRHSNYPRNYLVYDPNFSLHLLHNNWNNVSIDLKRLFNNKNPSFGKDFKNKDYFAKCLSWLIDIKYHDFEKIMNETKFILTENFAYKLFHVHERKLTRLSLIIEGDTGVGKTFLLKFYSLLLNSNIINAPIYDNVAPRILERTSLWLLTTIIGDILENEPNLLNRFLQRIKPKLLGLSDDQEDESEVANIYHPYVQPSDDDEDEDENENDPSLIDERVMYRESKPLVPPPLEQPVAELVDIPLLKNLKSSLGNFEYNNDILRYIWKTIMIVSSENAMNITQKLIIALHEYVTNQLVNYPLIEASFQLQTLLNDSRSPTVQKSIEIFNEYLIHTQIKPLFYRLLLHPGITEEQLKHFMLPICQLARELPHIELVIFFDEVNTSSCLGLFKEMFMDRTLHGNNLPKNLFFTAAINPSIKSSDDNLVHRQDYLVHQLPQALENLKVSYGTLETTSLKDYIIKKIAMFRVNSENNHQMVIPLEEYAQEMLADSILNAQDFCERYLGRNSVSQREIQRCFNLIEFFWKIRFDDEIECSNDLYQPNPIRCIALALALIYYFRLPTEEDNAQRNDKHTPTREQLARLLSRTIPNFVDIIQDELDKFVNTDNFVIPHAVAINQAVREHIFAIIVSIVTRTPLCIIGAPGQSKTLSFQIVLQNLQGSQLSIKPFCKRLPAIDPFFCLGSKYSRSEDIAYIFERALKREQQYEQNRMNTRCVVFLDEASLPDEKKMVLKVLHPYLDECKVAFVAIANKSFDAANANRMICVYRSLPSDEDQKILAYGCLGLQIKDNQQQAVDNRLQAIIYGLCQGYRRLLNTSNIPHIYHDRDFIYMLRELRFELTTTTTTTTTTDDQEPSITGITPLSLLRALEDNFNGVNKDEFEKLVQIFFQAVQEQCSDFRIPSIRRNIPTILHESMKLDSIRRRLYGRYKLIIDESEDESAVGLLSQNDIINMDPNRTTVFRMSDFPDDIHNELRNVEILSTIKLCMETGKTILMVNTGRIHGSLYDVFNQNFSIMATGDMRKIFSKVAIGPKTIDVVVHEDFQCIVHIKRSEFKDIPAPFLSRFQKYSLSVYDFYRIQYEQLSLNEQIIMKNIEDKLQTFIQHFGRQYFYGLNDNTLYSCLLSLIKKNENENEQNYFINIQQYYTQLNIKTKSFIEQYSSNIQLCILRLVISKLIQLVSPESIILKLPTFEDKIARWLCTNYFHQQEHFHIENFIQIFISNPLIDFQNENLLTTMDTKVQQLNDINITRKVIIFTRTSSYIIGLNEQSNYELFTGLNYNEYTDNSENIDILNLTVIENSMELEEKFQNFEKDEKKKVLIVIINARIIQQRLHIPYVRQLIDKTEYSCNILNKKQDKYFLMLIHSPAQEQYHQSSFPSIFLHNWDFYFFDSCAPGSAFHLQKMLQILSSSSDQQQQQQESFDNTLCDLNILFDDCLWDFCSRIQIALQELPEDMFKNKLAYEFYKRQTNTIRRVQCLKQILQQSRQLQNRIVTIYHDHLSNKKESSKKIYNLIYQISKDIICGKRFDGLVESIQSQTRISFTNFVSNVFKFIVNDYGLETLLTLSNIQNGYDSMLELIDYSSFAIDDNKDNISSINQGIFQLVSHYACIPQTPLYYLFHQRIKSYAEDIKLTRILKQTEQKEKDDMPRQHYYAVPSITTMDNNYNDENEMIEYTFEQFRYELIKLILNDKILTDIINEHILNSYSNDLVRTFCTIVEKNFDENLIQCQKTIEFISHWLLLVDDNDRQSLEESPNKHVWLLAHVYTSFEYDQNDLFSLYSACRITDRLDLKQSFYDNLLHDNHVTRSEVREKLFRFMFDNLWKNLCEFCSNNNTGEIWMHIYTFISKYYPSDKVLQRTQLIEIKEQIEFMNLAYLILINDKIPQAKELVSNLLKDIHLVHINNNYLNRNQGKSLYLKLLSKIIDFIQQYFENKNINNSTLMIDIQQWIISMLKSSTESCKEEIENLFKGLNQSTYQLSLPMKQLLFDKLANLYIESIRHNRIIFDCWERFIILLPLIIECLEDDNLLEDYQLPYHSSIIIIDNQRQPLIDLFFFHLQRYFNDEMIKCELVNKIMQSKLSNMRIKRLKVAREIFKKLKDYFLLRSTALLLCQTDVSPDDQRIISRITLTIINQYLSIDRETIQLNQYLQIFLSTIISKRSWNFLFNLLKSDHIQRLNNQWATTLSCLLGMKQTVQHNKYLQLCHQIQFTLSTNNISSIFPKLHQPYEQLKHILNNCVKENINEQQWKNLLDWIELKRNMNPSDLNLKEIKVILLLNIYYDYYCNNQLASLHTLLEFIENTLELLPEELRVFRAILQPEQFIIGYPRVNDNAEKNFLNNLFTLNCQDEDELCIRHSLVNLIAMILMGGKQSFLWTFAFHPSTLQNTFGFGSTTHHIIQSNGVHYDCGCIITQNGDLMQFERTHVSELNVPAVYVAYFSTFGALAWHLLLFNESVQNLHGPILAAHAIADDTAVCRLAGNNDRTKVCHFVRARLLSTFNFLSIRSNQDDACILLNRCLEQMAFLTINHQQIENSWIKPIFHTLNDELKAEQAYQNQIFYFVHEKLVEYKTYINQLNLQSQIQTNLQDFINQMPIIIQFLHFKTELHNPIHSKLPIKILRHILDSMDFLKITKWIYNLSQFYLLLHQTYTQLIEQDEFHKITLEELYNRGQKHYNEPHHFQYYHRNNNYSLIIDKGIEAVNAYHSFTDGLIRPGACDQTQRFTKITRETPIHYLVTTANYDEGDIVMRILSFTDGLIRPGACDQTQRFTKITRETPIHYLVTTANYDEGDIVMRILSVLIDYHNNLLNSLEKEMNNTDNNNVFGALKNLVNNLTSKEVSILQIVHDNTGVITLTENDCLSIEQLSCATLINENDEYFQRIDTKLNFDFIYLQSYIIRTYLLFCHINYRHIIQNYQCHKKRIQGIVDGEIFDLDEKYSIQLTRQQLENDWNHLKDMYLDKLYHSHNLLRQITIILKNYQDDLSQINLYEFIQSLGDDNNLFEQIQQFEIKDFQLCYIDHIRQLYANSISGFQHLFTDVSQLLRISIDNQLDYELNQMLTGAIISIDYNDNIDKIKLTIQMITDLLNDLRLIENFLLQQSNHSLKETCDILNIENSILSFIPNEIKCENYVAVSIHLIRMRTILQEQIVNIEEKQTKQWNENFNIKSSFEEEQQQQKQVNRFLDFLNEQSSISNETLQNINDSNDNDIWPEILHDMTNYSNTDNLLDREDFPRQLQHSTIEEHVEYSSLFELHIKFVSLTLSTLFEQIHQQCQEQQTQTIPLSKAKKFIITHPDGKAHIYLWKSENLFEKLRHLFDKEKYDINRFVIVDKNEILIDFTNRNAQLPHEISLEYFIIEKTLLYSIQFNFQRKLFEYFATLKSNISIVIDRFIRDNNIKLLSNNIYLCFFDEHGKSIDNGTIADLTSQINHLDNKTISITVTEEDNQTSMLCEITLRSKQ